MKKRTALALVVVAFVMGFLFSNLIPLSHAVETDPIDRTPQVLYPQEKYKTDRNAVIFLEDKYFHQTRSCPFIIGPKKENALKVSVYEAVERGFTACPNCFYETVLIK